MHAKQNPGDNWTGSQNPFGPKVPLGAHGANGSTPGQSGFGGWASGECNFNGQAQCGMVSGRTQRDVSENEFPWLCERTSFRRWRCRALPIPYPRIRLETAQFDPQPPYTSLSRRARRPLFPLPEATRTELSRRRHRALVVATFSTPVTWSIRGRRKSAMPKLQGVPFHHSLVTLSLGIGAREWPCLLT